MASTSTLSTWTKSDYQSATASQITSLTIDQVKLMAHPDWLLPAAVSGFTAAQMPSISISWTYMNASWLNALSASAFAAIPAAGVAQFASAAVKGLDAAHASAFTATQLASLGSPQSLSTTAVAALNATQLAAIPTAKWSSMSAAWLNAVPPSVFATLPATSVAKFSSAACAGLDVAHIQALTPTQMAGLYYPESLSLAAVAALAPAQVAAISTSFYWMKPAWLNALTPAALAAITPKGIGQLASATIAGLDVAHTQALTPTQLNALSVGNLSTASVAALTTAQLTGMSAAKWGSFSAAQLNAIALDKFATIPAASVGKFSSAACAGLDVAHVQALTTTQIGSLSLDSLSTAAIGALSPTQVAAMTQNFYWRTPAWMNALSLEAFAAIPANGIGQLSGTTIAGLDVAHVRALTTTQIGSLSLDSLSTAAIGALQPAQVAAMTQNFYWRTPAWLNALSPEAFAAIPPAGITQMKSATVAALDATRIGAMTAAQVAALDYWQTVTLQSAQLGWLSKAAVAGLSIDQLDDLTPAQIAGFTATQTAGLSAAQLVSLSQAQLAALSASAASGFNAAQLAALGTNLCVLAPAAIAALPVSTFSQLSLMQLSSLQGDQVATLTSQQLASLNATQVNYLTPGQLDVLGTRVQALSASALAGLSNVNLMYVYASLTPAQQAALTPTQTAAVQKAGAALGTLLGSLTDAGVRAQIEAVINSGESLFSYNSLVQVLGGVASSLGSSGLNQAQMNDLKALSNAVGQTLGTNSYLHKITSNVVNGDLSNIRWTGGAATSIALGNLAVGSSTDQMSKLVSKWFLGGDLPTWTGSSAYTAYDAPLFSASGPLSSEVSQGSIGDCYLLAAMIGVADDYASVLESMFTDNGNGTWGVRFYAPNDEPLYVTVSNVLPGSGLGDATSGALWVSLIEKAYVEWEVHYKAETNAYDSIDGGDSRGLQAIMGRSSNYYSVQRYTLDAWSTTVKSTVINALDSGQVVMYGSNSVGNVDADNGKTNLVGSHMFAVLGFDAVKDEFILQNPWGSAGGDSWNGVFDMSITELWTSNNDFIVTNEASPTGVMDSKYALNSVNQLMQAMATADTSAGAAATTTLLAGAVDHRPITLVAAA